MLPPSPMPPKLARSNQNGVSRSKTNSDSYLHQSPDIGVNGNWDCVSMLMATIHP